MTENGWPPDTDQFPDVAIPLDQCVQVTIPGTTETLWFRKGTPATIMPAFAADINRYIESLNNSAGYSDEGTWTQTNSVGTSNHLGATAMDLNWTDHPMGPDAEDPSAGWQGSSLIAGDEVPAVRALLDWYEGTIFWGADWDTPKDSMHFQMGYNTYDPATNDAQAWVLDFVKRKIGPDGFSTYNPNGTTVEPAPPDQSTLDAAGVLAAATGVSANFAQSILPQVTQGLIDSQCTNVNRVAMWLAQIGEESASFTATVEIGDIDGTTYQGRTWIQITGQGNYASFSQWAYTQGMVASPTYFVDNPAALGDVQWRAIGPAWYWTVERPQINGLCDDGDVVGVTEAINGGDNGIDDRTRRWNLALAQGDALLQLLTNGDDFMSALTDAEQRELLDNTRQQAVYMRASRSPLRWPNQGPIDTCAGFAWNADSFGHVMQTEKLAVEYGDAAAIANLYAVATTNEPNRDGDKALATKILAKCDPTALSLANAQILTWLQAEEKASA